MSEPIYIGGRETPLTPKEAEQYKKDLADFLEQMTQDFVKVITPEEARKWAPAPTDKETK